MLMFATVAALAVAANAQVLRISPAVIGSSSVGNQQVIQLGAGGVRPVAIARPVVFARQYLRTPIQAQIIRPYAVHPRFINVAQPIVARQVIAQPIARPAARIVESVDESPKPYSFAFDSTDEFGARIAREESANGAGVVTGSYTLADSATGVQRIVTYVADENGFRADVKTNEPGTQTSNPAAATYTSSAQ